MNAVANLLYKCFIVSIYALTSLLSLLPYIAYGHIDFPNPDLAQTLLHIKDLALGGVVYENIGSHHFLGYIIPLAIFDRYVEITPQVFWLLGAFYQCLWSLAISLILYLLGLQSLYVYCAYLFCLTGGWFFYWSGYSFNVQMYANPVLAWCCLGLLASKHYRSQTYLILTSFLFGYLLLHDQRFFLLAPFYLTALFCITRKMKAPFFLFVLVVLLSSVPFVLSFLYFLWHGAVYDVFHQTIIFPLYYRNKGVAVNVWNLAYVLGELPTLIGALLGGYCAYRVKRLRPVLIAALTLIVWGIAYVELGGRPYPHYYLILITPITVLALSSLVVLQSRPGIAALFILLLFMPHFGRAVEIGGAFFAGSLPVSQGQVSIEKKVATFVKKKTDENERIFVWGYAPAIYYYSNRKPAFKDIGNLALAGGNFSSKRASEQGIIESVRAEFEKKLRSKEIVAFIHYQAKDASENTLSNQNLDFFQLEHLKYIRNVINSEYTSAKRFSDSAAVVDVYLLKNHVHK